ncbi:MAG: AI-2E family transporter [Methylococcaceae bacterium]|nr:MAG: AI-2E family transporter [Methylococcaceae bacterium]
MKNNGISWPQIGGGACVIALVLWLLHSFLTPLAWAVVLAIATWQPYCWLDQQLQRRCGLQLAPVLFTLIMALLLLGPFTYALVLAGREAQSLSHLLVEAQARGLDAPDWLAKLPLLGAWAVSAWSDSLGDAETVQQTIQDLHIAPLLSYSKVLAGQVIHRLAAVFVTLLALFVLYRRGEALARQIMRCSSGLLGTLGERYLKHAANAVRGTVNGLVLVGLGEGLLLGLGYAAAGLPHPAMLGVITGVMAMVPFAAKLVFGTAALVLLAQGSIMAGSILLGFGLVVLFIGDNYLRPTLIGNALRLPFLWTLLGIFGGIENFGLIGLFLGPTVMAIAMSLWRDWTEDMGGNHA